MDFINLQIDKYYDNGLSQEEEIPALPKKPKTKLGDSYQLGRHRLTCVDSTKYVSVTKANLTLTDPPYNIGFKYNKHEDKMKPEDYQAFLASWFNSLPSDNAIITCGPRNLGYWYAIKEPTDIGFWLKKNTKSGATVFHLRYCEPILSYGKFQKRDTDLFEYSREDYSSLNEPHRNAGIDESHAPAKPLKLWRDLILNFSSEGDIIYDPFIGNGTTLIACEQTNRTCVGQEYDPAYIDVIVQRWEDLTGKKAQKL